MKKMIAVTGIAALLHLNSCTSPKKETQEENKFTVTSPVRIDTSLTKEFVSQIKSVRNIEIRAQEKGYLEHIYVDEGQAVKAGQLLFKIMPKVYEADLQKAVAESRGAEIEFKNAKTLADKNIVSKNEQLMAEAKLQQARAEVAAAKVHLSFTEIRAPFDGVIDRIPFKQGSLIDEGALMTSLSANHQMFAYFNVSEPEYLNYQTKVKERGDTKVHLLLANNEVLPYPGHVETIEGEFNSETGNIAFRARFPNPDQLLKNGQTGKIQMLVPLHQALVIPQKATYEIQDKTFVFIIDKNQRVHSRNISIAAELPDLYILSSGISAGDKILLDGLQKVKDNDKIHFEYLKGQDVISHLRLKAE